MDLSKQLISMGNYRIPHRFFQEALDLLAEAIKKSADPLLETALKSLNEKLEGTNYVSDKSIKKHFIKMEKHSPQEIRRMRESGKMNDTKMFSSPSFTKPRRTSILE